MTKPRRSAFAPAFTRPLETDASRPLRRPRGYPLSFSRTNRQTSSAETRATCLRRPLTVLLVALVCAPVRGLPEDAEQPLLVDADIGTYDDAPNGTLELAGNVQLQQGTLRVEATRVTATKRDGKLFRVVATGAEGAPARFRQQINREEPVVHAHARSVDYGIADQQTKLTGDAFLSAGEREYNGGVIVWDMKENRVECRAGCRYTQHPRPTPD